jgi:hypothetical protein
MGMSVKFVLNAYPGVASAIIKQVATSVVLPKPIGRACLLPIQFSMFYPEKSTYADISK